MGVENTEAVVLRYINYGEADRIYTFYTLRFGKIKGIIKGIRKSRKRARIELLSRHHILFYRRKTLHIINACDLIDPHLSFYGNLQKTFYGIYFAELIDRVSPEEESNAFLYELFCFILAQADKTTIALDSLARIFEIRLMALIGYRPYLEGCVVCHRKISEAPSYGFALLKGGIICRNCQQPKDKQMIVRVAPGTIHFLRKAQQLELGKVGILRPVLPLKKEIEGILQRYIQVQLEVKTRSYRFLSMVC